MRIQSVAPVQSQRPALAFRVQPEVLHSPCTCILNASQVPVLLLYTWKGPHTHPFQLALSDSTRFRIKHGEPMATATKSSENSLGFEVIKQYPGPQQVTRRVRVQPSREALSQLATRRAAGIVLGLGCGEQGAALLSPAREGVGRGAYGTRYQIVEVTRSTLHCS